MADGEGGGGGGGGPSTPATRRLPRRVGTARSGRKAVIGGRDPLRPRRKVSKPRSFYQRCSDMMMGWPFFPKMGNSKILFRAPDGGRLPGQDGQWEISRVEALDKLCAFVNDELEIPMEREADEEVRPYQLVPGQCSADPSCSQGLVPRLEWELGIYNPRSTLGMRDRIQASPAPPRARACAHLRRRPQLLACEIGIDTGWRCPRCAGKARRPCAALSSRCSRANACAPPSPPSPPFRPAAERCLTHPRAWPHCSERRRCGLRATAVCVRDPAPRPSPPRPPRL